MNLLYHSGQAALSLAPGPRPPAPLSSPRLQLHYFACVMPHPDGQFILRIEHFRGGVREGVRSDDLALIESTLNHMHGRGILFAGGEDGGNLTVSFVAPEGEVGYGRGNYTLHLLSSILRAWQVPICIG